MKAIGILAAALLMSTAAAQAQQNDPTNNTSNGGVVTPQPTTTTTSQPPATNIQSTAGNQQQYQYRVEDRVVVPSTSMPDGLRQTLQAPQYQGWQNSTLYQDRTTGNYYYQTDAGIPPTGTGSSTTQLGVNTGLNTQPTTGTNPTTGLPNAAVPSVQNAPGTTGLNTPTTTPTIQIYSFDRTGAPLNTVPNKP
jgi:hypothetical protein